MEINSLKFEVCKDRIKEINCLVQLFDHSEATGDNLTLLQNFYEGPLAEFYEMIKSTFDNDLEDVGTGAPLPEFEEEGNKAPSLYALYEMLWHICKHLNEGGEVSELT